MTETNTTPKQHPRLTLEGLINDTHRVGAHIQKSLDLDGFGSITSAYRATPVVGLVVNEDDAARYGVAGFQAQRVAYDEENRRAVITLGPPIPTGRWSTASKQAWFGGLTVGLIAGVSGMVLLVSMLELFV